MLMRHCFHVCLFYDPKKHTKSMFVTQINCTSRKVPVKLIIYISYYICIYLTYVYIILDNMKVTYILLWAMLQQFEFLHQFTCVDFVFDLNLRLPLISPKMLKDL